MPRKRSTANALKRLFSEATQPVYVLDAQRTIAFCNEAFTKWIGCSDDELLERRCDYHSQPSETPLDDLLSSLCPPAEALAGNRTQQSHAVRLPTGTTEERMIEFTPLVADAETVSVIAIIGDVQAPRAPLKFRSEPPDTLHRQLSHFRSRYANLYRVDQLIGESPLMVRVREQTNAAIASQCATLIYGPTGSGRDHLARTIHYGYDAQGASPMLPIACSLFDAELLQATVTSFASRIREDASQLHFSLLLFDVEQLADDAQHELLGLLAMPRIDIRPIATSSIGLSEMHASDAMNDELLQRVSTIEIGLPPLSDRREDIPLLAQHFLEASNIHAGKQLSGFAPDALSRLAAYEWPGNIDDLRNAVTEASQRADGVLLARSDLPTRLEYSAQAAANPPSDDEEILLDNLLLDVEREVLRRALAAARGNKAQAARSLGISRARLHRRVDHFGLG